MENVPVHPETNNRKQKRNETRVHDLFLKSCLGRIRARRVVGGAALQILSGIWKNTRSAVDLSTLFDTFSGMAPR
jgi:hypothetical protein